MRFQLALKRTAGCIALAGMLFLLGGKDVSASCVDTVSDIGSDQLQEIRLALADSAAASGSIRILAYIFNDDASGIQLLQHLIAASQRGATVQLLIDGIGPGAVLPFSDEFIAAIHTLAPRFEIKIYNPKYRLASLAYRMHDKLFLSGEHAVIGSSSTWNASVKGWLLEKDIYVHGDRRHPGSVLEQMDRHFAQFWNASESVSQRPLQLMKVASLYDEGSDAGKLSQDKINMHVRRLTPGAPGIAEIPFRRTSSAPEPDSCLGLAYVYDLPGKPAEGTLKEILSVLREAKKEIVIVNPYIIFVPEIRALLASKIKNDHVRVLLVTTSIVSLAAEFSPLSLAYAKDLPGLASDGFEVREYAGADKRLMLHSKIVRVDGASYFVGSFNFDPLSARSNTENGVWITSRKPTPFTISMDRTIASYIDQSQWIADGAGNLMVTDPSRCEEIDCHGILRSLAPLIRSFL